MSYHKSLDLLPELQQIEGIIAQDKHHYLSYEILNHIPYQNQSFPIHALSLGRKQADEPCIALVGGVHGLERIGTQVVLTFLQMLLNRLRWDLTFEDILQRVRIVFLPLLNPVGMLKKTRSNGAGIDLMRNAPVDCLEKAVWLGGGHRISDKLPWYRGVEGEVMQPEVQTLYDFIQREILPAPFSLTLDCHSAFGMHN